MVYTWSDLFWIFYIYSLVGWCARVVANALRRKRFFNIGFRQCSYKISAEKNGTKIPQCQAGKLRKMRTKIHE